MSRDAARSNTDHGLSSSRCTVDHQRPTTACGVHACMRSTRPPSVRTFCPSKYWSRNKCKKCSAPSGDHDGLISITNAPSDVSNLAYSGLSSLGGSRLVSLALAVGSVRSKSTSTADTATKSEVKNFIGVDGIVAAWSVSTTLRSLSRRHGDKSSGRQRFTDGGRVRVRVNFVALTYHLLCV